MGVAEDVAVDVAVERRSLDTEVLAVEYPVEDFASADSALDGLACAVVNHARVVAFLVAEDCRLQDWAYRRIHWRAVGEDVAVGPDWSSVFEA